jgi:hypothetical protein
MRKVFLFDFITLDGFFDGINGDLSWHNVDEEFHEFAINQLDEVAILLFGSHLSNDGRLLVDAHSNRERPDHRG